MRNRRVRFQVGDVYFPDGTTILKQLRGEDVLEGKVIDLSESGKSGETFLVVEVDGLARPLVVPLRCVQEAD